MYAIRVYKDYEHNRIVGFRVVNERTLEYGDFSIKDIKSMLMIEPTLINNLELDSRMTPRLKNYIPEQKQKYYTQTFDKKCIINHYCIILGSNDGTLNFIADTEKSNIISGTGMTLGEIASKLGQNDIYKLKLYNASIKMVDSQPFITIYCDTGKYGVQLIKRKNIDKAFGKEWLAVVSKITQEGVELKNLVRSEYTGEATIPDCVCHIEHFDGGVNVLNIPISVHSLGEGCFENATDLYIVKLCGGLKVIPEDCFRDSSLREIKLSGNEEIIAESAFEDCCDLSGALVTKAKKIGKRAFASTAIGIVSLDGTEVIDIEAFAYNYKLHKIKLEEGLKVIKGGAFRNCDKITTIKFPYSLEKIEKLAFSGCKRLKKVYIGDNTLVNKTAFPKNTIIDYYTR